MEEVASDYFAFIQEEKTSKNDETNQIKEELDKLELEFSSDPVFVALMKAERKTELG